MRVTVFENENVDSHSLRRTDDGGCTSIVRRAGEGDMAFAGEEAGSSDRGRSSRRREITSAQAWRSVKSI